MLLCSHGVGAASLQAGRMLLCVHVAAALPCMSVSIRLVLLLGHVAAGTAGDQPHNTAGCLHFSACCCKLLVTTACS